MAELTGSLLGAALTLLIFSYLLGDNPLYRLGLHLFIGALVGYTFGVVLRNVLFGKLLEEFSTNLGLVVPLVLGILLLFKGFPKHAYVGNLSIAFLIGVGTAVALSGALLGTLVPQVGATGRALSPGSIGSFRLGLLDGLMIVVGTVCTLMVSTFTTEGQRGVARGWARFAKGAASVGRVFLVVALGIAFAGALTASLSIFIGRFQYLVDFFVDIYFRTQGG
jgi:hypothetical protein